MAHFKKYRDARGEWRWIFYAANGEEIAVSSEGYIHEAGCQHAIDLVKQFSPGAVVRAAAASGSGR